MNTIGLRKKGCKKQVASDSSHGRRKLSEGEGGGGANLSWIYKPDK